MTTGEGGRTFVINPEVEYGGGVIADDATTARLNLAFAALADPIRRDIVARLSLGDATVNELAAPYGVSLQAISKHLKVLEAAGLVSRRKEAQRRPVHLEADLFGLMLDWIQRYQRQAERRFRRLDAVLAGLTDDPTSSPTPTGAPAPHRKDPS